MAVTEYGVERCDVFSYVLPHTRAIFTVNFTFAGDSMSLNSSPYLDDPANVLTVQGSPNCVLHSNAEGSECTYVLKSVECRPLYVNEDEDCVFERFGENVIKGIDVTVTKDSVDNSVQMLDVETALETARFDMSNCEAPANVEIVNVTDTFVGVVDFRNQPSPDWSDPAALVRFYDEIVVQLSVDVADQTATELQIQRVMVTVEDPENPGVTVAKKIFNKGDKILLHEYDWNNYYRDGHFCRYHDPATQTCENFYETGSDRINPFYTSDVSLRIAGVCQTAIDTTSLDFFTFDPSLWFAALQLPQISVKIDALGTMVYCDGRDMSRRLQEENDTITTINYVQYSGLQNVNTIFYSEGNATDAPVNMTATSAPMSGAAVGVAVSAGVAVIGAAIAVFAVRRRGGSSRYDEML